MKPITTKVIRVPKRLAPRFQEYNIETLDLNRDANLIIQRVLEFGTWREIRWLFRVCGRRRIARSVRELGERGLSRATFHYWRSLLGIKTWKKSPFAIERGAVWPYS